MGVEGSDSSLWAATIIYQCPVDAQACSFAPQLAVGFFTSFLGLLSQVLIEAQHKVCLLWQDHHPLASSMNCADALALHVPDAASAWAGLDRASNLARFTLSEPPSWPGLRPHQFVGCSPSARGALGPKSSWPGVLIGNVHALEVSGTIAHEHPEGSLKSHEFQVLPYIILIIAVSLSA